jgi:hypothetical protein
VTGFQISRVTNRKPKCESAGQAPRSSDSATPPRISNTRIAALSVARENLS